MFPMILLINNTLFHRLFLRSGSGSAKSGSKSPADGGNRSRSGSQKSGRKSGSGSPVEKSRYNRF